MKKLALIALAVLMSGAVLFGAGKLANAQSFHAGDSVSIHENKPVENTVFAAGQNITIDSDVFGDVFCAGQTITILGTVHGDVLCAGQTITVSGDVTGDVRLAGQTVTVNSKISGNATIGGDSFVLESAGTIKGDATIGASKTSLNGSVGRDVILGSKNATLASSVGRNVTANVESLTLTNAAEVGGDIDYTSATKIKQASDASVLGTVTQHQPEHDSQISKATILGIQVAWILFALLATIASALFLVLLFPQLFKSVTEQAIPTPWRALLVGFLAHLAAPFVLIMLFLTVFGIPIALLALGVWILISVTSGLFSAFYVGRVILGINKAANAVIVMLVGVGILALAQAVPLLGFFVFLLSLWVGTGMLLLAIAKHTPKPNYALANPAPVAKTKKK